MKDLQGILASKSERGAGSNVIVNTAHCHCASVEERYERRNFIVNGMTCASQCHQY